MKPFAVEYPARREAALVDIGAPPEPRSGQILIRTRFSGITNGTERHALLGEHGFGEPYPSRHGYQNVGVIEVVGEGVRGFGVGEWVFFGHYVGHRGWHIVDVSTEGIHPDPPHLVHRLPAGQDPCEAALLGVAGVAMRHVRRLRVSPAANVWVAGQGPIGAFAAQCAHAFGARVTVSDLNPMRLDAARRWGPARVLDAADPATDQAIRDWAPYDVIIEACGAPKFYDYIAQPGIIGHHCAIGSVAVRSETTFRWSMLHGTEASIEVSCHFSLDDLRVLQHLVGQGRVQIAPMVSHVEPIERAVEVYGMLRDRPNELLGVVFDWTR
jgi:2-desacetyl-2-hydroxyethyl bacteriochlorophyllide A dehydrogenase